MVYYRKYRPQTVTELDLESVRVRLTSILSAKELPHAFLFTGPKGLGKTSAARILAKAINCEQKQLTSDMLHVTKKSQMSNVKGQMSTIEPCNKCDNCVSITNGSNIDVLEIDAASNRGIDEIRDLREKIKFSPANLPKKVYIIDEVHMLTTDAFNALLKTLEEPPSHAVFVLCTTEVEKVPPTIVSRTFHVQFAKPSKEEIVRSLNRIVEGEKLIIEPQVLDEIYKLSEGSFRDASKILEEVVIGSPEKKITNETLFATYKTSGLDSEVQNLLTALSKKDLQKSMKIIEELFQKGADFKVLAERIAANIHSILMGRAGIVSETPDIENFETGELTSLLGKINDSYRDIKFSVLPQIPLELVVVEFCLDKIQNHEVGIMNQGKNEERVEIQSSESPKQPQPPEQTQQPKGPQNNHGVLFSAASKPENFLAALFSSIKQDNHSIAGILRGCNLVEITEGKVVFETKYKFHNDRLNESKAKNILDKRASEILKENVSVIVKMVEK